MIHIDHLTKRYPSGKGIFDIHFDVKEGEVFGFLGPNGAGKTTTIRQLLGFTNADEQLEGFKYVSLFTLFDPNQVNTDVGGVWLSILLLVSMGLLLYGIAHEVFRRKNFYV